MATSRWCPGCERNRALKFWANGGQRTCDTCRKKAKSASAHRSRVRKLYGLTVELWDKLLEYQLGACAGCGQRRVYRLNVDHDHETGLVRGLLCRRCNKVLRDVRDDINILGRLRLYLMSPPAQELGIVARATSPESTPPAD